MSTHPVSNFPEAEFRFSRADRRCSCSRSQRRCSSSRMRPPRSRSRCCSNDRGRDRWDSLPFCVLRFQCARRKNVWSHRFTLSFYSSSISPKKQSRPPPLASAYAETRSEYTHATPAYAPAPLRERPRTRPLRTCEPLLPDDWKAQ